MTNLSTIFLFSLSITTPIFIVLALGLLLAKVKLINDGFIETGSKLVFNVTLPALLFISISQSNIERTVNIPLIALGLTITLFSWTALELLAHKFIDSREDRGVVVQGGFRSNMGIFGLAYCINAYGNEGLVVASLYMAAVTILFNILSVISLNRAMNKALGFRRTLIGILKNPLIIAISLALVATALNLELPSVLLKAGEYFANMTLPLALLCVGASLDFSVLRKSLNLALYACLAKLILIPALMVSIAIILNFRGIELGVLLLMASAPTASASYVMVRALGGNAPLAANIIVLSTLGSLVTTSLGTLFLTSLGYM